ncbi:amino acid adenylation domain-containing protein [Pseudoalteromonas rhizosphaerae]|uniref:non-ribosomal peptide synthetase n=1 Tax=Pseudoalteromonas rhizosphaerae TaxID=2518973 RepID=UPI0021485A23|nr:amino acid adenylation domain-containing protein [Pseudoalteromonas rhizosphaerae]
MDIQSLIKEANSVGISLFIKNGKLGYKTYEKLSDRSILGKISNQKSNIISYLEQQNTEVTSEVPVSLPQRRIWLAELFKSEDGLHNIPIRLRLSNHWDFKRLEQAIASLVVKHEILRTCYYEKNNEVYQKVEADPQLHIEHHDCFVLDENEVERQVADFFNYSFSLQDQLPIRVGFFKTCQQFELCLLFHHIALDDTACQIFMKQMFDIYQGNTQQPLQYQYRDYAIWQIQHIQSADFQHHAKTLCNRLQGAPQLHRLQLLKPHNQDTRSLAKNLPIEIPLRLSREIKDHCQTARITEFSFYHTTLALLIGHWSKTDEVMLGTPIIHRPTASMTKVLGCFLNLMPIRHQFDDSTNFTELSSYIQEKQNEVMRYQDVPFEYLLKQLKPSRQPYVNPLFQIFVSSHTADDLQDENEQDYLLVNSSQCTSKYDLTLKIVIHPKNTTILWQYREDLFSAEYMKMMSESFVPMLQSLLENKEQSINTALSSIQYPRLAQLKSSCSKSADNLLTCIANHAQTQPNRVAIRCQQQQLNYQSVQTKLEALSQHMVLLGLKSGDRLGLMLTRNCNMVIAMLAALRLGLVYIPMDPEYPKKRLKYIAEKAQCKLILKDDDFTLDNQMTHQTLSEQMLRQPMPSQILPDAPSSNDLAYAIFTSGSTGQPKGVMINQHNLANFLTSMVTQLNITSDDALLAITPISFDISVLELFVPLMAGGEVVIAPQQQRDGLSLKQQLNTNNITIMQATPAGWQSLLDAGWNGSKTLKALSGGERLPTTLATELNGKVKCLWNMYGPTEATVWATSYLVEPKQHLEIPLGQPINNSSIHILDELGKHCPPQMRGEIVIVGDCVGQGYIDLADETATRFITLLTEDGPKRAYRTGDIGYIDCNNTLFCLGRNDHQVKVRGFRIELQEIEKQLQQLANLGKVCVVVHLMPNGSQKLIAYCATHNAELNSEELLYQLRNILPPYMVPDFIVSLDNLPLTLSGKIDRNYLAMLPPQNASETLQPPTNEQEYQLVEMWQALLNVSEIGINCNFFSLGGDSISAIKLASQLQKQGFNVSSVMIFQHQTIKDLAKSLIQSSASTTDLINEQNLLGVEVVGDAISEADLKSLLEEFTS